MEKFSHKRKLQRTLASSEGRNEVGEIRARLWNAFASNISEDDFNIPSDRPVEILDLGCSICNEADIAVAFFSGRKEWEYRSSDAKLYGIDLDENAIKGAVQATALYDADQKPYPNPNYKFYSADATKLNSITELPPLFDVVLIRHPEITHNPDIARAIIQEGIVRLGEDGLMMITNYTEFENKTLQNFLGSLKGIHVKNRVNAQAKELTMDSFYDGYVTLVRKTPFFMSEKAQIIYKNINIIGNLANLTVGKVEKIIIPPKN